MVSNIGNSIQPEEALWQCLVAFGGGVGHMHVSRKAIKEEFWGFFIVPFSAALPDLSASWELEKDFVLGCANAMGRLAALHAIKRGSYIIESQDIKKARKKVVEENPVTPGGKWCTPGGAG